jgi:hypothetical protein
MWSRSVAGVTTQRRGVLKPHRLALLASLGVFFGALLAAAGAAAPPPGPPGPGTSTCRLGNGVQHVVILTFDNVHFFRDNPNVPSDLEMMPNLLDFFEQNGTFLSNNHTPLIAHTGDDILTTLTGLYGDRQGMPIANDYQSYNADGSTDPAASFAYWTDPIFDTAKTPNTGHDTNPSMVYSPVPPATASSPVAPDTVTPAPWVPWTRAGCNVGGVSTANIELENNSIDIPKVFGASSPEVNQLNADSDSFKDAETADYDGVAIHCAIANNVCTSAKGIKFGQTTATPTAVPDALPDEPGGYHGFEALFGHRYVAPQLGAGTPNVSDHGFQVTNAAGNLVDLNGNQINGAFLTNHPGFPGFSTINASQTLAYMADMQESGVPVTYGYISDIHGNEHIPGVTACNGAPAALGSGSACYVAQAQYYNDAFGTFFKRLAADGITPANTLFVLSSDEGDHEAGANVGRAIQPTPADCDGSANNLCTYPTGTFGELDANVPGLLSSEKSDTTPFSMENDTAPEFYLTGNPSPSSPTVRQFDRDVGTLTSMNPYTGNVQTIANYLADPTEEAILHMVNADPARTPTLAMFAKPDYFLQSTAVSGCTVSISANVCISPGFAWDHGDYAAEIDTNYAGFVGPGVARLGLDGSGPQDGPDSAGPNSGQVTVPGSGTTGTWMDETDIQPTMMYLAGLKDDYVPDGRVVSEILSRPGPILTSPTMEQLGACYKQINSSVGELGTDTLIASTTALDSSSPDDEAYKSTETWLSNLDQQRDKVAGQIKDLLDQVEFGPLLPGFGGPGPGPGGPGGTATRCGREDDASRPHRPSQREWLPSQSSTASATSRQPLSSASEWPRSANSFSSVTAGEPLYLSNVCLTIAGGTVWSWPPAVRSSGPRVGLLVSTLAGEPGTTFASAASKRGLPGEGIAQVS